MQLHIYLAVHKWISKDTRKTIQCWCGTQDFFWLLNTSR